MKNRQCLWEGGLVLLAICVRAATVLVLQSHHVPRSTFEHGEIAANILNGHGFSIRFLGALGPTSQQAPIYPALVALAYAVGGVETPESLLILELAQALLGGLLVLGVMRLARGIARAFCGQIRGRPDHGAPSHPGLRRDSCPGGPARRYALDMDNCVCVPYRDS